MSPCEEHLLFALTFLGYWLIGSVIAESDDDDELYYRRPHYSNEQKIKRAILRSYDKTTRPVVEDDTSINVNVAISLFHILDANEKEQTFTSLIAVRQRWRDEYLVWNASQYGGINTIRVPADRLWTPDLVISNFAGDQFSKHLITNAIVSSTGDILWLFPALIKTYCSLNVELFPFDSQKCEISFISWTHSGGTLDLHYNSSFPNVIYFKSAHQEWSVDSITAVRNVQYYACCSEPYPDVKFTIHMRRGSLFYVFTLISPCFLIYVVSFLGFYLPIESGEKVNLEITILLALVVFLLSVGETMPPTPDAIPLLGMFFGGTMLLVTIAVFMAVSVTNIYSKKDGPLSVPAWALCLTRPPFTSWACCRRDRRGIPDACHHRHHITDYIQEDTGVKVLTSLRHSPDDCADTCCMEENKMARSEQWKRLARGVDKVYFWLFTLLSVTGQVLLFLKMRTNKEDT